MSKISYGINLGKESAARAALEFVKNEMTVGLGTGSTAKIFVDLLAQKVFTEGLKIRVLATSSATNKQARQLGLPLTTIDDVKKIMQMTSYSDSDWAESNLLENRELEIKYARQHNQHQLQRAIEKVKQGANWYIPILNVIIQNFG